jgi:hypothetical protein
MTKAEYLVVERQNEWWMMLDGFRQDLLSAAKWPSTAPLRQDRDAGRLVKLTLCSWWSGQNAVGAPGWRAGIG